MTQSQQRHSEALAKAKRAETENEMAGMRRAIGIAPTWMAVLLSSWLAAAGPLQAETVPLPTPAPAAKDKSPPAAPPATETTAPSGSGITNFLDSLNSLNPFGKSNRPASDLSAFDAKQKALVNRVSAYLTSVQTLSGNFVQIGPDGRRTTGQMYIQKPGRVRFEYDPPNPVEIVADGSQVVVRDRQLSTQDLYPLSQTPLRYLLADKIDLLQDTNVVAVTADETFVSISIEEKQPLIGTNRLMMMFDAKDFKLKQWTITDVQGLDTTVAVSNLDSSKHPDPNLFRIDYTRAIQ